jgi:hypothetical protein
MIWDDPWIAAATTPEGTLLPPAPPIWPAGVAFACARVDAIDLGEWAAFVGTEWTLSELRLRLADAWIPIVRSAGNIVGTCVLRPRQGGLWILETLKADKGFGAMTMRAGLRWIWDTHGPCAMGFTWELTVAQLMAVWWRGWLRAATSIEWGWAWAAEGCSFCPAKDVIPTAFGPRYAQPVAIAGAVVNDSGAHDGWGHVCMWRPDVDWSAVAKTGGWKRLWLWSSKSPGPGWRWTGEVVVVGVLNRQGRVVERWVTAEI